MFPIITFTFEIIDTLRNRIIDGAHLWRGIDFHSVERAFVDG